MKSVKVYGEALQDKKLPMSLMLVSAGPSQGHTLSTMPARTWNTSSIAVHWVSNVDGWVLVNLLSKLSASTTLVIVSSKSFGTAETLLNAETIRNWFIQQGIEGEELCKHFVVVSSNEKAGEKIGVPCARRFPIWDWVGGRFSVWSATGLPLDDCFRSDTLMNSLRGAHQMDMHSIESEPEKNLPLTLALLSIWNSIALNAGTFYASFLMSTVCAT